MNDIINQLNTSSHIIVWTLITFFLLLIILGKWGWPAILGALEAREQGIQDDLDEARRQREEAEKLLLEHKKLMTEADDKIRALVDEAKRDADVLRADIESKARAEAEAHRERTLRDIELAKDAAIGSLREESVSLSILMASKILDREVTVADRKALVQEGLKGLGDV